MAAELKRLEADIVLLQEVDRNRDRSGNRDITHEIARALNMHSFFASALVEEGGEYGNAVLSHLPFLAMETVSLGPGLDHTAELENRSAAHVTVKFKDHDLSVLSTHLAFSFGAPSPHRINQLERLMQIIHANPSRPAIMGGDFNVEPDSPDLAPLSGWMMNATPGIGPTCSLEDGHRLAYEIDRIYTYGLTALKADKLSFPQLSDHCIILADLELDAISSL